MLKYLEGQGSFAVFCLAIKNTISAAQISRSPGSAPDLARGHTDRLCLDLKA